jgi:hypothetical protein
MGRSFDFDVVDYDLVVVGDADSVVSSTRIRRLVSSGELEEAARLLGRDFELRGSTVPLAADDGATLAFEVPEEMILPRAGRYEGSLRLGERDLGAVEIEVPGPDGQRPDTLFLHRVLPGDEPVAGEGRSPARLRFVRPLSEAAGGVVSSA